MPSIGVDIGGTSVKFGVVTTEGEVIAREACPSPKDWQAMAALIAGKVTCLRSKHPGPVGICTAGTIGPDGQVTANQLGWNEVPLGAALQAALGEKVPLIHDGHSALMAESVSGALRGMKSGLLVQLGTGIGGGFLSNGQPYVGRANVAPEIGHIITHADGLPCSCGQIGCWEAYASASALSNLTGLSAREALSRIVAGELQDIWQGFVQEVTIGLMSLIGLLSPEAVAIGGGMPQAGPFVLADIKRALTRMPAYQLYYDFVHVLPAQHGNDAGIIGAALSAERMSANDPSQGKEHPTH